MIDSAISKYIQKLWRYTNGIIHYIIYIHICSHLRHSLDAFHCISLLTIPVACVDHLKYRFLNLDKSFFTSKKNMQGKSMKITKSTIPSSIERYLGSAVGPSWSSLALRMIHGLGLQIWKLLQISRNLPNESIITTMRFDEIKWNGV